MVRDIAADAVAAAIAATASKRPGRPSEGQQPPGQAKPLKAARAAAQRRAASTPVQRAARSSLAQTGAAVAASPPSTPPSEVCSLAPRSPEERQAAEEKRAAFIKRLGNTPPMDPKNDPRAFHGRILSEELAPPSISWASTKKPREGSESWLTATEYEDQPFVLAQKVRRLASLLRVSHRTVAYTGAGLSVAAGIAMAAAGSAGQQKRLGKDAQPTLSHYVMASLNKAQLLHGWVQQNHDGLPQKAGYRQEDINEIHGSWFDPSNPVVKYSGTLRHDLCENMEEQGHSADLCLVVGTSLTGLNADQVATGTAERSLMGRALGTVIISPQRTAQDGHCSLRIFAKADDVMRALAQELSLGATALGRTTRGRGAAAASMSCRVCVPYDSDGLRSSTEQTYWDLSVGQKVRLGDHHNCNGARQENSKKLTSKHIGEVVSCDDDGIRLRIGGANMLLGHWWLAAAARGGPERLPVVNARAHATP